MRHLLVNPDVQQCLVLVGIVRRRVEGHAAQIAGCDRMVEMIPSEFDPVVTARDFSHPVQVNGMKPACAGDIVKSNAHAFPVLGGTMHFGDAQADVADTMANSKHHLPAVVLGTGDEAVLALDAQVGQRDGALLTLGVAHHHRENS